MPIVWSGCYDETWRDLIVPAAFAHPAKMSRALLERIIAHLFELGVERGSLIVDPFGGIGTTAIIGASRGLRVVCCELEPKFVALARENIEFHRRNWEAMDRPIPTVIQGDSRNLRQSLAQADALIASPPYAEIASGAGGLNTKPPQHEGQQGGRSASSASQDTDQRYGEADGQLARLPKGEVDAVVGSPPFTGVKLGDHGSWKELREAWNANPDNADKPGYRPNQTGDYDCPSTNDNYGEMAGQMGEMPTGDVDAVIGSPPFLGARAGTTASTETAGGGPCADRVHTIADGDRLGTTEGQLAALAVGDVDAVIASPPYSESISYQRPGAGGEGNELMRQGFSVQEIAAMRKSGDPRVLDTRREAGYSRDAANLGNLAQGDGVDAVVSSPPFTQGYSGGGGINVKGYGADGADKVGSRMYQGTGAEREPGNLETMPFDAVDGVVSSPPYEGTGLKGGDQRTALADAADVSRERGRGKRTASVGQDGLSDYGDTEGQMGAEQGETFWTAAQQVVQETFALLKPGGYAVWVVKAFVRNKKLVDFPGDWRKLCEHAGFVTLEEIHASLVQETTHSHLFDGEVVKRKERKSFFRRLAEKKGSPKIDYEVVWVMQKPTREQRV